MLLRCRKVIGYLMSAVVLILLFALFGCGGSTGTQMGATNPGKDRDTTPVVQQAAQPGAAVVDTDKATMDYSNTGDGYISVLSKLDGILVKVLVNVQGAQYQYSIAQPGAYIVIPLSCGSGSYSVGVYEHVVNDQYAAIFSQDIEVAIADEYKPFLMPNQYVSFAAGDATTQLSQQSASGATSDVEALNGIYKWVVENVSYDNQKAATVQPGYLPDNTNTINSKTGICFDYAVLTAAMLREQQIPAKLVIGYSDTAYHAWITVYCKDTGTVIGNYSFNGSGWERMDPTFDAAAKGAQDISSLVGSGTNYQPMFYY